MGRIALAAAPAAALALVLRPVVGGWHPIAGAALALPVVGLAYLGTARALGLPEAEALLESVRRVAGRGTDRG